MRLSKNHLIIKNVLKKSSSKLLPDKFYVTKRVLFTYLFL